MGQVLASLVSRAELRRPEQPLQLRVHTLQPTNRPDLKMRVDYNISNNTKAYVRAAIEDEEVENARGIWWGASDVALPTPNLGTNKGRSVSGNVVSVLSPTMTNEVLVSWSRLTLDNTWQGSVEGAEGRYSELAEFSQGFFPSESPYLPQHRRAGAAAPGNLWAPAMDVYAHNDALSSPTS